MRNRLLTTVALLSGIVLVSADGVPSFAQGQGPGAPGQGGRGAPEQSSPQRGPSQSQPQPSPQKGQREQGQPQQRSQQQGGERDRTTGQGQREQVQPQQRGQQTEPKQRGDGDRTTGQGQREQGPQPNQPPAAQRPQDRGAAPGQAQQPPDRQQTPDRMQEGRAGGTVNLSPEQRTRIRTTVLAGRNVPRVNNVTFALRVGTIVPTTVRVVEVPPTLIEIYPEWRSHYYFVVNDDIVIVDREHHIVAMVPVGTGGGARYDGNYEGSGPVVVMSADEIRQIQIALRERGYDVEVDGVLGPRTRQVLIMFQREQGLPSTGKIDQRTVTALKGGQGQGDKPSANRPGMQQPSTTGQGVPQSDRPHSGQQPNQPPPASQDRNPQNRDGMGNQNRDGMGNRSGQPMGHDSPR